MHLDMYLNKMANVVRENKLLKFAVVVIGAATIFNAVMIQKAFNSQRTILLPAVAREKIEVGESDASEEYISEMARQVMGLTFNYIPANAREQFSAVLTMYISDGFPEARRQFYLLADQVETAQNSSAFYIQHLAINPKQSVVTIKGLRRQFSNDLKIEDGPKTYQLWYQIVNGRFRVVRLTEGAKEA
ncbi:MAG: type IV conjugative transfer system protein TraE [Deltaproteobacteria bacterium]|nr:type IV conjugative transfer system protein TraE [Deltaproteobacteria bacterium]